MIDDKDSFHPALLTVLEAMEHRLNHQREVIKVLGHSMVELIKQTDRHSTALLQQTHMSVSYTHLTLPTKA